MTNKLTTIAVCLVALGLAIPCYSQENRRDGNWWLSTDKTIRLGYVVGFLDGIHLGQRFGATALGIVQQDSTEWTERCQTSTDRYYLNPKQIFKGLYANPNFKGQLLADVWVKVVPRTDTTEGQKEYESHLKELKKRAK